MYKEYFGFSEEPFQMNPDPLFLYMTYTHLGAMSSMIAGIRDRKLRPKAGAFFHRCAFLYAASGMVLAAALGIGALAFFTRDRVVIPETVVRKSRPGAGRNPAAGIGRSM